MKHWLKHPCVVLAACISLLLIVGLADWKWIAIQYHSFQMERIYRKVTARGQATYHEVKAYEKHRDVLVTLGYLDRREFVLDDAGYKPVMRLLATNFPGVHWEGHDSERTIVVWARSNEIHRIEETIKGKKSTLQ